MTLRLRSLLPLVAALLLGTTYAGLIGLVTYPLRASLISWPIWIVLFWFLFQKFKLTQVAGPLMILPVLILSFEVTRTILQPPQYAYQLISLDRSHYTPRTRVLNRAYAATTDSTVTKSDVRELYIGEDGFRADPETGRGNPARCHEILIGDSMIYGSGLPYSDTLRPVLARMNVDACVFGVTGNSPVDYLATLNYVQDRIDDGAHIAIYVYVYNDFVSLTKYVERKTRELSPAFAQLTGLINYYDDWRRATFIQTLLRGVTATPKPTARLWHMRIGDTKEIKIYWPHDPSQYPPERPINQAKRATFQFFLQQLRELVAARPWRVSIVFIPDNEELLANLAHPSSTFRDLDPRRVEGLKICATLWPDCHDLTPYLYKRVAAEGQNPYLLMDRHLSRFGNQILAEHYMSMDKLRMTQSPAGVL